MNTYLLFILLIFIPRTESCSCPSCNSNLITDIQVWNQDNRTAFKDRDCFTADATASCMSSCYLHVLVYYSESDLEQYSPVKYLTPTAFSIKRECKSGKHGWAWKIHQKLGVFLVGEKYGSSNKEHLFSILDEHKNKFTPSCRKCKIEFTKNLKNYNNQLCVHAKTVNNIYCTGYCYTLIEYDSINNIVKSYERGCMFKTFGLEVDNIRNPMRTIGEVMYSGSVHQTIWSICDPMHGFHCNSHHVFHKVSDITNNINITKKFANLSRYKYQCRICFGLDECMDREDVYPWHTVLCKESCYTMINFNGKFIRGCLGMAKPMLDLSDDHKSSLRLISVEMSSQNKLVDTACRNDGSKFCFKFCKDYLCNNHSYETLKQMWLSQSYAEDAYKTTLEDQIEGKDLKNTEQETKDIGVTTTSNYVETTTTQPLDVFIKSEMQVMDDEWKEEDTTGNKKYIVVLGIAAVICFFIVNSGKKKETKPKKEKHLNKNSGDRSGVSEMTQGISDISNAEGHNNMSNSYVEDVSKV